MCQRPIARGINDIGASADDGQRRAACAQAAMVRGRVDAKRHAGNDAVAGLAECGRKPCRICQPLRGRIAAADYGDRRARQQIAIAFYIQEQRRIGNLQQVLRIRGVGQRH